MKLKKNFVLRQIVDTWVVLPLAEQTVDFSGMLTLNESGALLWKGLENGGDTEALVEILTSEYTVSKQQARADVEEFIFKLEKAGCIEA